MDKALIMTQMEASMMVVGLKIRRMALGRLYFKMALSMTANGSLIQCMEREFLSLQMEINMKVIM